MTSTSQADTAIDQRALRQAFGKFTTGVTIVTADVDGKRVGMTANSFSSLSLDPPLVLWSVRRSSTNFHDFMAAKHFAVNVLSTSQIELSQRFAKSSETKFDGVEHGVGIGGSPVFEDATVIFECSTEALHEAGDHVIMVGRVHKVAVSDHTPLVFAEGRYSATIAHPSARPPRPEVEGGADPLHQFVSVLLLRAYNRISDAMGEVREAEDLSLNESRILNLVCARPGRTLPQLMPRLYLAEQAAEDTVQELLAKGFVSRGAAGALDATAAGRTKSDRVLARAAAVEARFLKDIPAVQVDHLRSMLEDIIEVDAGAAG